MSEKDRLDSPKDINTQIEQLKKQALVEMGRTRIENSSFLQASLDQQIDVIERSLEQDVPMDVIKDLPETMEAFHQLRVMALLLVGVRSKTAEQLIAALMQRKRLSTGGRIQ